MITVEQIIVTDDDTGIKTYTYTTVEVTSGIARGGGQKGHLLPPPPPPIFLE